MLHRAGESIEGRRIVGSEVVDHNYVIDPFGSATPVGHWGSDPSSQGFCREMNHPRAVALVVGVDPRARSRARRERVAPMVEESLAGLVEADDWTRLVVWFVIEIEYVLHVVDQGHSFSVGIVQ